MPYTIFMNLAAEFPKTPSPFQRCFPNSGGPGGTRTRDLVHAMHTLFL